MGTVGFKQAAGVRYRPEDVILEIGANADIKRGSTAWLARIGPPVVAVDIDASVCTALSVLPNVTAMCGSAEQVLDGWGLPVGFAWLDGYDWPYSEKSDEYWAEQRARYVERGQEYSQDASSAFHLRVAQLIFDHVAPGGVIAFDDTWYASTRWDGKGRDAVPYLIDRGYQVLGYGDAGQDISTRMVSLHRGA